MEKQLTPQQEARKRADYEAYLAALAASQARLRAIYGGSTPSEWGQEQQPSDQALHIGGAAVVAVMSPPQTPMTSV